MTQSSPETASSSSDTDDASATISPMGIVIFVLILWSWTWIGGYLLHPHLSKASLSLFFLLGPLVLPILFTVLGYGSKTGLGLTRSIGGRKNYVWILLLYFALITMIIQFSSLMYFGNEFAFEVFLSALILSPIVSIITTIQAFMEEVTWSGWLYRYIPANDYLTTSAITAGIWFVWHVPFFLWTDQLVPFSVPLLIILVFHLGIARFLYNWFRFRSDSVIWPSLAHGLSNTTAYIVAETTGTLPEDDGYMIFVFVIIANLVFIGLMAYSNRQVTQYLIEKKIADQNEKNTK